MPNAQFEIRPAQEDDRVPLTILFAAVAEEGGGIATEPPVDIEASAAALDLDGFIVAVAGTRSWGRSASTGAGSGSARSG